MVLQDISQFVLVCVGGLLFLDHLTVAHALYRDSFFDSEVRFIVFRPAAEVVFDFGLDPFDRRLILDASRL